MQIKHLNLVVSDTNDLATFFERHFDFRRLVERGSGALVVLGNDEDFVLTLMKPKKSDPAAYPEMFHAGFFIDDLAALQAKRDELAASGLTPGDIQDAGRTGHGAHFYCTAPGGVMIEVAMRPQLHAAG